MAAPVLFDHIIDELARHDAASIRTENGNLDAPDFVHLGTHGLMRGFELTQCGVDAYVHSSTHEIGHGLVVPDDRNAFQRRRFDDFLARSPRHFQRVFLEARPETAHSTFRTVSHTFGVPGIPDTHHLVG